MRSLAINKNKMDKEEANELIKELNELSEFEEQNIERMKEIAHVLVQYYLHPNISNKWDSQKKN